MPQQNFRIITIDDNEAIHDDYRKVLCADSEDSELTEATEFLFGETQEQRLSDSSRPIYQIDSALQGMQGIELVKQSVSEDRQYACAFVDIRMPPGIDGVETSKRIWEIDPNLPIVLCTAY